MRRQSLARSNFCRPISVLFRQNMMGGDTTATQSPSIEVPAEEVSWHPRSSCSTFQSRSIAFLLWYTCSHVRSFLFSLQGFNIQFHRKKGNMYFGSFDYPSSRRISWASSEERFLSSSQYFRVEDNSVSLLVVTRRFSLIRGTTFEWCPAFTKALLPDFASVM